jgi:hypothetical protein
MVRHILAAKPHALPEGLAAPTSVADQDAAALRLKPGRRPEPLQDADFLRRIDARDRGRLGSALIVMAIASPADASAADASALLQAACRAVRSGDTVGLLPSGRVGLWIEGVPPDHLAGRMERLRMTMHRLGVRGLRLTFLAVSRHDERPARELIAAAMQTEPVGEAAVL